MLAIATLYAFLVPLSIEHGVEILVENGPITAGASGYAFAVVVAAHGVVHEVELFGSSQLLGRTCSQAFGGGRLLVCRFLFHVGAVVNVVVVVDDLSI